MTKTLSSNSWAWQTFKIIKTLPCWRVQFSSVTQSCPTLCDPMNSSTSGLPVHHQLPEFTQTHVHRFSEAIQSSHPLFSPSPPAPNPSQHQSLFQWVNSSQEVAKELEFQLQHHSLQRNPRADLLQNQYGQVLVKTPFWVTDCWLLPKESSVGHLLDRHRFWNRISHHHHHNRNLKNN